MPHEDGFSKVKNPYIKSTYYSICDGYGAIANEIWMNGLVLYEGLCCFWLYRKGYKKVPITQHYMMDNSQCKGFMRKGIAKVSRSMGEYQFYLFLTYQILTRSNIVGNSASTMNAQQKIFK